MTHRDQRSTNRNWITVLMGQEPHSLSLRVASEKFSSQVDSPKRLKHITSILRPLRSVPAVRAYGVLQSVLFLSLDCSPYSGQRRCCSASSAVYGGLKESTLCVWPHFWYPNLLNRIKFDISVYFVSCTNFVSCFDGEMEMYWFSQKPRLVLKYAN